MWNSELEICVTMWWADENHVSDTTAWRCQEHDRDRMATFGTHLKMLYSCEMTTKCHISWDCRSTLFGNILNGSECTSCGGESSQAKFEILPLWEFPVQRQECYTTALTIRCGYWLIHGTKHRKDNQSEKLNHLYKIKYTKLFRW